MPDQEEFHFKGQQPGERVALVLRQHPFVLVEHALKVVGLLLLAVFSFTFAHVASIMVWLGAAFIIAAIIIGIRSWYGWWNTMLLLTNERVLFVEQKGFANRKMSEALLDHIQFVTNQIQGVIHTMFNFGDVKVQTAGSQESLLLRQLYDPYEIQQNITKLQREVGRGSYKPHHSQTASSVEITEQD